MVQEDSDRCFSFVVSAEEKTQRIDGFLASRVEDLTRSRAQDLIRKGWAKVNDALSKSGYRLKSGDRVQVTIPAPLPSLLQPEPVEFDLIHEDSSLIILNKPPGLVTHPAPGHPRGTLVHGLLQRCRDLSGVGGVMRPGIVHRLDKDTSGLMVVAKNDLAHTFLCGQFKSGSVRKRYLAIVHGVPPGREGKIDLPIARHPVRRKEMAVAPSGGRRALSLWEKVEEIGTRFSLLAVSPRTGRTHQIRVHLSHAGHPVLGDPVYGYRKGWWRKHMPEGEEAPLPPSRQMLHAESLGFVHPESGVFCEFRAPMPSDMKEVLETLRSMLGEKKLDKDCFSL
ncbi:MAG: RluA family pseudouridine synthase [Deltaproteobacteria bacterium]|nr:RluA family pseudouridine synthase [Deltaproteobacteria bacterium]